MKLFFALFGCVLFMGAAYGQAIQFKTQYAQVRINDKGYIVSMQDRSTGKEYCPAGRPSALLSLYSDKKYILPVKAVYDGTKKDLKIDFSNGSVALVKAESQGRYIKFRLLSLTNRKEIDNVVWGPYKTNISKTIGDLLGVVRSDDFAIGMLGLDDNTTSGPPTDGDMSGLYYFIHSPDPVKYPLPANLKEGQCFSIGGDGNNDVAFFSHPEEYYRMSGGNGAQLEPAFGSSICMHSRDRRKEQMIRFPNYPDNVDGKAMSSRYQLVTATNADFIGSSIALYLCPDSLGLNTIENIVLNEGLPHPTVDGKWIKDPTAYMPDIAWSGVHDSLIGYAHRLGLEAVQDEGWGEYYPNPANRWTNKQISFASMPAMSIPEYGALMQKNGIRYGLHTLCEFLQPNNNSDVAPVPSDSLVIMQRTTITKDISESDTIITIADTAHFNEFGGWEGNHTNVLKIGKELIGYNGVTTGRPYTFLHLKRGLYGSKPGTYKAGTTIVKLQPNCYHGFAPDMNLEKAYADYYGKWLTEGGMDYIDFDGLESCMYQGQGQYSFKRFFRELFDSYYKNGGKYLRVMGSGITEGNWHYMSVCNVGGGDHMFNPVQNKWGIEGKDVRYIYQSSYLPATFGIINMGSDWSMYDAENLEAKSMGWDANYMLGLSQRSVEAAGEKEAIFTAYRTWEKARKANVFTKATKTRLKDLDYKFHLEQAGDGKFILYPVRENRFQDQRFDTTRVELALQNEFDAQPLDFAVRIRVPKDVQADGIRIRVPGGTELAVDKKLSNGQFIIYKNGKLYLADRNRKEIEEIAAPASLQLPAGRSVMSAVALHTGSSDCKFECVVTTIGKGERL